jgi:hypothetical protein
MAERQGISWGGVWLRIFFALVLVLATYNPSGYSYYTWVVASFESFNAMVILAGVVLLIGWAIYIRATMRSLGPIGLVLALAFFGALLWVIIDFGLVAANNINVITWLVLFIMSIVLGIGMSWSFVRRRMSGQYDVDDTDDI